MTELITAPRRGRPPDPRRRQELIEAAFHLLAERGFDGLRVRDVAARAGVHVATLHHHFPEKADLVHGVLEYATQRFRTVAAPLEEGFALPELLQEFADTQRQLDAEPDLFRALFALQLQARQDVSLQPALETMERHWAAHLGELVRAAQAQGRLGAHLSPDDIALEIIALIKGAALQHCCGAPAPSLADAGRRYLTRLVHERNVA